MEIKEILFPTDFSESSGLAAEYALDLAKRYGARVHILHVIYDIALNAAWYAPQVSTEALYEEMQQSAKTELERVAAERFAGFGNIKSIVIRGIPHDDVLAYARDKAIDLIVMGSHGRKGLDRVFFGSTASKVVKNAECPVLTVRVPPRT